MRVDAIRHSAHLQIEDLVSRLAQTPSSCFPPKIPGCWLVITRLNFALDMPDTFLRASPSQRSEERDVRVEDFLNDKLQTHADLENLDSLLENVREQQSLLKQQVCILLFDYGLII